MLRLGIALVALLAATACTAPAAPPPAPSAKPVATAVPTPDGLDGNMGGLISNDAGGLVSNNAGAYQGTIMVPKAALVDAHAGALLAGSFGGLVAATAAADALEPAPAGTRVRVLQATPMDVGTERFSPAGAEISYEPATVGLDGVFQFTRLKASGPLLVVRAVVPVGGHDLTVEALVAAPRAAGLARADAGPASTLVARKLRTVFETRRVQFGILPEDRPVFADLATAVTAVAAPTALVAGPLLPEAQAVAAFDAMVKASPALRSALDRAAVTLAGLE